jgi:hypothetical protein
MRQTSEYFSFRVSRDCEVAITFYGPVTQEAIDKLQRTVALMRDCFPEAEGPKSFDFDPSRSTTEAIEVVS